MTLSVPMILKDPQGTRCLRLVGTREERGRVVLLLEDEHDGAEDPGLVEVVVPVDQIRRIVSSALRER